MLVTQLKNFQQESFTGAVNLKIEVSKQPVNWQIFFYFGKLIWANGGVHSERSWRRHLTQYCPQVELDKLNLDISDRYKCPEYYTLAVLMQRGLIEPEIAEKLIASKTKEVLFDIFQQIKLNQASCILEAESIPLSFLLDHNSDQAFICVELAEVITAAQNQWSTWAKSGFASISPNISLQIRSKEKLKQQVSEVIYQNFVKLLDGQRTLRDLAVLMNKDVLVVLKSLTAYIRQGLIGLTEIPDLPITKSIGDDQSNIITTEKNLDTQALIACIDDSPQVCQIMKQIITKANYRFLEIQQPIQAVPSLINANPQLIFLDISMPILNGYEVCTQIRRVSKLQDIPIVMLTGNDGVFDRVKAKVCGASDFLSKPVEIDKILQTIEKYVATNAPICI